MGLALESARLVVIHFLWVAAHTRGEVVQINTRTCQVEGAHRSWGMSPSRTAVAADGSVWVGNRGWGGDASDYRIGNAVHLNVDGTLICRARITGTRGVAVRALALDQEGNAWIGSWDKRKLYRVSGSQVELGDAIDEVPDCKILQEVNIGDSAYGAAIDSKGFLWVIENPSKVDTRDGAIVGRVPTNNVIFTDENGVESRGPVRTYGIAIDRRDNVWYGTTSPAGCWCASMVRPTR